MKNPCPVWSPGALSEAAAGRQDAKDQGRGACQQQSAIGAVNAQDEDQEQRRSASAFVRWHRQARSGVQAPHPDQEDHKNKRHLRGAVTVHETNMGHMAQMLPFAGLLSQLTNKEKKCLASNVVSPPRSSQEGAGPWPGLPRSPRKSSASPKEAVMRGRAVRLPRPPQQEARVPPALDCPYQRARAENGLTYSKFMAGLKKANIDIDRKVPCRHGRERSCRLRQHRREGEGQLARLIQQALFCTRCPQAGAAAGSGLSKADLVCGLFCFRQR